MASAAQSSAPAKSGFIAGPWTDVFAFILSPLIALVVGQAIVLSGLDRAAFTVDGMQVALSTVFIRTLIHAHQVAVFVRTHGNAVIFRQFRMRFTVVPAVMLCVSLASDRALSAVLLVSALWDVYHTSMQTFGLCRIYDALQGNPPSRGRAWDLGFAHAIYVIPIFAGPLLPAVLDVFSGIAQLGQTQFLDVPMRATQAMATVRPVLVGGAVLYCVAYVIAFRALVARGHVLSGQKVLLMVTSSIASIYAAGFDPLGQGLLVINTFHAVQYLALLWHVEGTRVTGHLRQPDTKRGRAFSVVILLAVVMLYGLFAGALPGLSGSAAVYRVLLAVSSVITVLHFWYDGFVWSVRKQQATS